MMLSPSRTLTLALFALAALGSADGLLAQAGPGAPGPAGWAPPSVGVRFGWDNKQRNEVLGAAVRLPILPSGQVELMGGTEVTFLRNLTEYEFNAEAVYVQGGRAGGVYGGGGLGLRNTIYPGSVERRTELGFTLVVGVRLTGLGILVPQVESRWIFIDDAPFTFQTLTLGVNLAFWRPTARD